MRLEGEHDVAHADFGAIEPWVWTMSSTAAFVCFVVVPDRLKDCTAYGSLTAMVVNLHYAVWAVQVSEWAYIFYEVLLTMCYDPDPEPHLVGVLCYITNVVTLLYAVWKLHARHELRAREKHQRTRPDEYRRDVPLIPSWGLMVLWSLSFSLLFQWVGGLHILMGQVTHTHTHSLSLSLSLTPT